MAFCWLEFCWLLLAFDRAENPMDQKKTILIVDDNEVIVKTLALKLEAGGYRTISALDGSEALSAVRKETPDLILLDISFPPDVASGGGVPWDGFRMLEWFRRMEEAKSTPTVIITGGEAAKYKDRALAAGAAAFFHKPIDHDELLGTIAKILSEKRKPTVVQR
jgi:CheY-like chemotaxis protein